jgi:uncharacterized iron-regulated protein
MCCIVLAACALGADRPDAAAVWNVAEKRWMQERELVDALAGARYRLLGEMHDNPAHHAIRARLLRALAAFGARPAVVLEQFDLAHDDALRAAQLAGADAERLADAGGLDRKAWAWPLHKPIVEAALRAGLTLRAGNLSRARLRDDAIDAHARARLRDTPWSAAQTARLREAIVEGHCGKLPDSAVPRVMEAQRLRDAAMAQALVDAATADGAILVAGNGPVRRDTGVPAYLDASERMASVGFVEASEDVLRARVLPPDLLDEFADYDFVWITAAVPRDDPCAGLERPA